MYVAGVALNVGAAAARGEALAFCDADDEVGQGWVAAMGEALAGWMQSQWQQTVTFARVTPTCAGMRTRYEQPQRLGVDCVFLLLQLVGVVAPIPRREGEVAAFVGDQFLQLRLIESFWNHGAYSIAYRSFLGERAVSGRECKQQWKDSRISLKRERIVGFGPTF